MQYYFILQYQRISRWLQHQGVYPSIGIFVAIIVFYLGSWLLFAKTTYAEYIYTGITILYVWNLSGKKRNDQMKLLFPKLSYRKIRLVENVIFAAPFLLFLLANKCFMVTGIIITLCFAMSYMTKGRVISFVIPTPFAKKPFEFIIGFRKTFWLFIIYASILFKAIEINNFNLGIFTVGLSILTCLSYYFKPESSYFVWIYNRSTRSFLWEKIRVGIVHSFIITLPLAIALSVAFYDKLWIIVIMVLMSILLIPTLILAKYSAFPHEMNIPQALFFSLSVLFPPFLLIAIPVFYKQATNKLNNIL